jgi:CspA family cold shock protein
MPTGKVKFYDVHKNYGFITSDDHKEGERDVFVHFRELKECGLDFLRDHQKVNYDLKEVKGKTIACNIRILES